MIFQDKMSTITSTASYLVILRYEESLAQVRYVSLLSPSLMELLNMFSTSVLHERIKSAGKLHRILRLKTKRLSHDIIDGESEIDTSTYAAPKGKIICK